MAQEESINTADILCDVRVPPLVIGRNQAQHHRNFVDYFTIFKQLIIEPFQKTDWVWGIVPLYFSWAFAEFTGEKPNFKTAIQTGFNLLWAGAQWTWQYSQKVGGGEWLNIGALRAVNMIVTVIAIILGALALYSGLRRRFPKYCSFLGHSRFSSYFTITLFPMQVDALKWTWDILIAILIFAIPTWILLGLLRRILAALRSSGKKR